MAKLMQFWHWLAVLMIGIGLAGCQRTEITGAESAKSRSTASRPPATVKSSGNTTARGASMPSAVGKTTLGSPPASASSPASTSASKSSATTAKTEKKSGTTEFLNPTVQVSPTHDAEVREILDLARKNRWEEAEAKAETLRTSDPQDPAVQRVYTFVKTEGPKRREQALEEQIRTETDRGDTRLNPTVRSLLTDKKSQSLPPRSDLREAIENLKAAPYIPDSYGKTIQARGNLEDFESKKGRMSALLDRDIEVHLDNVTLEDIIFRVGSDEGINFIADRSLPAYQQKLSVNMKNVKLAEFLRYVQRNLGVQFQVGGDLIWITDAKDTNHVQRETRFFKLKKGFVIPAQFGIAEATKTTTTVNNVKTETETQKFENFVRDGAPREPGIETAIRNFFTGEYLIDYERNLIVARGNEEQLQIIERIINEFDKPIQQVLIEARFITVTESSFLKLGVVWETGRTPITGGRTPTDFTGLAPAAPGLGIEETWYGILGAKDLSATLTALKQSGESETLSSPRVTLINNLPATISDGKVQYYYEEYKVVQKINDVSSSSSLVPSGKPVSITAGASLDVLASIGANGKIYLALNPEVNEDVRLVTFATVSDRNSQGQLVSTFDIKLPEARRQSLATRVFVKSGQTVVMGGVLQREQKTFVESVPVLSNLPLIGAAFRRREEVDQPRYLLVFVTATLLSENGEFLVNADAN